jgi:FkbM family methyltransferase
MTKIASIYNLINDFYHRHFNIKKRRVAWWMSQIGKREYIERKVQKDIRMRLYFDSKLSEKIFCRDFELGEQRFINDFLRPGDIFVDAGANIGLFALIAAHRVGKQGGVYAFEPCAAVYQRLLDNVQLNHLSNVFCYKLALSDQNGEANIKIPTDGYDAWSSLGCPSEGSKFKEETVQTLRWDDFAQKNDLVGKVTMMKIDVEGWEMHVLKGGFTTLSGPNAPLLQVEFTEENMRNAGSSCRALYGLLQELGYKMYSYDLKSKKLIPSPLRDSYLYCNLFALKPSDRISARIRF